MPKFNANLTMLFNELDFLDRFEAASHAGFRGVEYLFPYAYPKEQLAEQLAHNGLTQVLHNLPAGDWAGEINYPFLFKSIDKLGYRGWIGCEYKPAKRTTEGLAWVEPYLKKEGVTA
jgi:hydroxypyruvate isomerase